MTQDLRQLDDLNSSEAVRFTERDLNDEGAYSMRAASFCALAIAASLWWLSRLTPDARHESIVMLVPAIAAAFGPFFLVAGVRSGLRLRLFGHSSIEIEKPMQGEPLRGIIRTARRVNAVSRYTIHLRCEDIQGRSIATTLFKGACHVPYAKIDSTRGIPFAIEPLHGETAAGNSDRLSAEKVKWWIEVRAHTDLISYLAVFDISSILQNLDEDEEKPWWLQVDPEPLPLPVVPAKKAPTPKPTTPRLF